MDAQTYDKIVGEEVDKEFLEKIEKNLPPEDRPVKPAPPDNMTMYQARELVFNNRAFQGGKCYTRSGTAYAITDRGWRRMTPKKGKQGAH